MKLLNKSIFAALAVSLAALTSCSDDNNYQPGAESAGCYFEQVPETRQLSFEESSFTVLVGRSVTDQAITVPVAITDASGLFSGASEVSFAQGQATAEYVVGYDASKIVPDKEYEISLKLASDFQYGVTSYTFTAVLPAPWTSLGKATYTDNIISSLYKISSLTWEVEIQENDVTPGVYRLIAPYEWFGSNVGGCEYVPGDNNDMEIHAENPNQVYFPLFSTGIIVDADYGQILAISLGARYLEAGNPADLIEQKGFFGTLKDGIIEFPVNGISVVEEAEYGQGFYNGNTSGTEQILFPGVTASDYSAEITYAGLNVDTEGVITAIAKVSLGTDVENAIVGAVLTDDPQTCISAMLSGKADVVSIENTGAEQTVNVPVTENGDYTLMVITEADGEYQLFDYTFFSMALGGGAKEWEAVGEVEIVDGWLIPRLKYNNGEEVDAEENTFFVPVEESTKTPGVYRLKSMYSYSMVSDYMEGTGTILVDASNKNFVKVVPQSSGVGSLFGFNGAVAIPMISNMYGYYTSVLGATDQQAQGAIANPAVMANDEIIFPSGDCGLVYPSDEESGYYNGFRSEITNEIIRPGAKMTFYFDNAQAASVKAKKSIRGKVSVSDAKANGAGIGIKKPIFRRQLKRAELNF